MSYSFPADLAEQVVARWQTFVARHDSPAPPLPPIAQLKHVLETAFFASLCREEGRDLRFVLCCAPSTDVPREGASDIVPAMPLQSPRPLSVASLRSLGPAVSPENGAILVRCPPDVDDASACEIAAILNVGAHLSRGRSGRSFYHQPPPYALTIEVRDAGELHIYRGEMKLATLKSGGLQDQLAFSGLEFLPIASILALGGDALRPRVQPPSGESLQETSDFEWTALLNTVLSIVNGIKEHGHGGTMLLVAPGSEETLPTRMKFEVDDRRCLLSERFVSFLNARHELATLKRKRSSGSSAPWSDPSLSHLERVTYIAEEDLADAADLTARLSAVDGALVVSSDLRVLGFGAEIVLDAAKPVPAYELTADARTAVDWVEVDSESFGMRHRSALRCVAVADRTAAFVVSQDGAVSFFWKQKGRVLIKRDVGTANPNMLRE